MLTDRDKEIVECLLSGWDKGGHGLYGGLSYGDVLDFCDKFGIPHPPNLVALLAKYDKSASVPMKVPYHGMRS